MKLLIIILICAICAGCEKELYSIKKDEMRILKINNTLVDIDEQTTIGIDIQNYDVKSPGKRFISVSNQFTIPATSNNLLIFGHAQNVQSTSTQVYETATCDYWVGNEQLIENAKCRVDEISDRISIFIYQKDDVWNDLKLVKWPEFIEDYLDWMQTENGLPSLAAPDTQNYTDFLDDYIESTAGIVLPFYIGNYKNLLRPGQKQAEKMTITSIYINSTGGVLLTFTSALVTKTFVAQAQAGDNQYDLAKLLRGAWGTDTDITDHFTISGTGAEVIATANEAAGNDATFELRLDTYDDPPTFTSTALALGYTASNQYMDVASVAYSAPQSTGAIYLNFVNNEVKSSGGHFAIYMKSIFEYIEYAYNVNFGTDETITGNIWDDTIAPFLFIPARDIYVHLENGNNYFSLKPSNYNFEPLDGIDKEDKSLSDVINVFFQHMNAIIDTINIAGEKVYAIRRFDQIKDDADVLDWSGKLTGKHIFRPTLDGYAQNNYIKFKSVYESGSELVNSKLLTCSNVNIDANTDLFEIDAHVPSVLPVSTGYIVDLSTAESLKEIEILYSQGFTTHNVSIVWYEENPSTILRPHSALMKKAELYNLDSEYTLLDESIKYPKLYEIQKWLSATDIRNFEFFKLYFIRELNGSFFVNKIKGFNPDKANEATTIELLRVSDKTPPVVYTESYWVDGVADIFVDGETDPFIYLE